MPAACLAALIRVVQASGLALVPQFPHLSLGASTIFRTRTVVRLEWTHAVPEALSRLRPRARVPRGRGSRAGSRLPARRAACPGSRGLRAVGTEGSGRERWASSPHRAPASRAWGGHESGRLTWKRTSRAGGRETWSLAGTRLQVTCLPPPHTPPVSPDGAPGGRRAPGCWWRACSAPPAAGPGPGALGVPSRVVFGAAASLLHVKRVVW